VIVGLIGYLILTRLEKIKIEKYEMELIFFSTFIFLWVQFLLYKKAFLFHGVLSLIQQNVPIELAARSFENYTITNIFLQLGLIPLILGIYCIYKFLFRTKNKQIYLYISLCIGVALFTWLKLIEVSIGFMYLGVCLSILSGPSYVSLVNYFKKIYFVRLSVLAFWLILLLIIPSMILPSLYFANSIDTVDDDLYNSILWLKENTRNDSVILAAPKEGHLINAVGKRKNIADNYFILIDNVDEIFADVRRMFETQFQTEAIRLFDKYSVDYVLITNNTVGEYGIEHLNYESQDCISNVYNNEVTILHSRCRIKII